MDNLLLSFMMMIFWSVLFCFLFLAARKIKVLRNRFGISACIVVCVCLYIRMLVPFDIGIFRYVNIEWGWFCFVYDKINMEKLFFGVCSITQALCVVWVLVAAVLLIDLADFYRNICRAVSVGIGADQKMLAVLDAVMADGHFRIRPRIVVSEYIRTPYSIGLLHHRILVPGEAYSETELYYILFHEMTHFRKGDLWIKALANIMCRVFWWNPLVFLIRREMEAALEIRCDTGATAGMETEGRQNYLKTILKVLKTEETPMIDQGTKGLIHHTAGFARSYDYDEMMKERFMAVANKEKSFGERKALSVFWVAVMAVLMIFSYLFVVSPYYKPDASEEFQTSVVPFDEIEIIEQGDGTYQLRYEVDGKTVITIGDEESMLRLQESRKEMEE